MVSFMGILSPYLMQIISGNKVKPILAASLLLTVTFLAAILAAIRDVTRAYRCNCGDYWLDELEPSEAYLWN